MATGEKANHFILAHLPTDRQRQLVSMIARQVDGNYALAGFVQLAHDLPCGIAGSIIDQTQLIIITGAAIAYGTNAAV